MSRPIEIPGEEPVHHAVVDRPHHGMRLVDFLSHLWPDVDRTALRHLVAEGRVEVNADEASKPKHRLRRGDAVQVTLPGPLDALRRYRSPRSTAGRHEPIPVLHEDEAVLVVAKPPGIAAGRDRSARDRSGEDGGLLDRLIAERGDPELRLVYRPDRGTSGCLLVAKTVAVAKELTAALRDGRLQVEHLALVNGVVRGAEHEVDRPLGPDRRRPGRLSVVAADSRGARPAVSRVTVEEPFRQHTLVRVRPVTWRNHQVPVHLAYLGHPVVADPEYGVAPRLLLSEIKKGYKARPGVVERPLLERPFLHIDRVRLPVPGGDPAGDSAGDIAGEAAGFVTIEAPLPKDLTVVLAKLRSFAAP